VISEAISSLYPAMLSSKAISLQFVEQCVHRRTGELFRWLPGQNAIWSAYASFEAMFGTEGIVERTALIGYCTLVGLTPDARAAGRMTSRRHWRHGRGELRHGSCPPN
jgi:hypothetical protein